VSVPPDAFGYAATAITFVQLPPQVIQTVRTRDVRGVAPMMWAMLLVAGAAWLLYGLQVGLVPSVVVNVLVVTCCSVMMAILVRERAPGAPTALRFVVAGLPVVALVAWAGPVGLLGALAALGGAAIMWPQAIAAMRSDDLSGLSAPSFVLGVAVNGLWLAFGIGHANPMVWISASQSTALSLLVVARILVTRRSESVDPPTGPVPITV
jgi:uncharacterized protein with PQ loop repeat